MHPEIYSFAYSMMLCIGSVLAALIHRVLCGESYCAPPHPRMQNAVLQKKITETVLRIFGDGSEYIDITTDGYMAIKEPDGRYCYTTLDPDGPNRYTPSMNVIRNYWFTAANRHDYYEYNPTYGHDPSILLAREAINAAIADSGDFPRMTMMAMVSVLVWD